GRLRGWVNQGGGGGGRQTPRPIRQRAVARDTGTRRRRDSQRKHPAEIVALGPSCASHRRLVSAAGIRLDHRKSVRPFKGIFCDDIFEFESSRPSHAVGSLWRVYPVHGLCEQRRLL